MYTKNKFPNITKEFLEQEYVLKDKTILTIATENNCSRGVIKRRLSLFNIPFVKEKKYKKGRHPTIKSNDKFGYLTILYEHHISERKRYWKCKCDCGNEIIVKTGDLISDNTTSCGCQSQKAAKRRNGKYFEEISGTIWARIIKGAATRDMPFKITIKYAWNLFLRQSRRCALSGQLLHFPKTTSHKDLKCSNASLDRIDSKKGYVKGNVQWVHKVINMMKGRLDDDKFIDFCISIANKNKIVIPITESFLMIGG